MAGLGKFIKKYIYVTPGSNRQPLDYVVQDIHINNAEPQSIFLDDYVATALLNGEDFTMDAAMIHTLKGETLD